MGQRLIAYYRVSTAKQGASGLGLERQEAAVRDYARASGGQVLRGYVEVETGKKAIRAELGKALGDCRGEDFDGPRAGFSGIGPS
jgi:DNA invertase Pin-like site-specific DNA recombinase